MEDIRSILQFWFGDAADNSTVAERQAPLWWGKDQATDALIRTRFGPCRTVPPTTGWRTGPRVPRACWR